MLDCIGRTSAEYAQIRFRNLDPMDASRNLKFVILIPLLQVTGRLFWLYALLFTGFLSAE